MPRYRLSTGNAAWRVGASPAQAVLAGAGTESQLQALLAERYGARPARGSPLDLDPPSGKPDPMDLAPASDALRWARGE
jgi:hypothetical protein